MYSYIANDNYCVLVYLCTCTLVYLVTFYWYTFVLLYFLLVYLCTCELGNLAIWVLGWMCTCVLTWVLALVLVLILVSALCHGLVGQLEGLHFCDFGGIRGVCLITSFNSLYRDVLQPAGREVRRFVCFNTFLDALASLVLMIDTNRLIG